MIRNLLSQLKDRKRLLCGAVLLALGVLLALLSSLGASSGSEKAATLTLAEYKAQLEEEISELCALVEGVGKCRVTVTFSRGEENTYKGSSLVESKPPKVLGVSVVCRGGDSDKVKKELSEMLSALFDIGANRISVLKLNS